MNQKRLHFIGDRDLKRRRATRKPFSRILLVFEGQATEPNYFSDLRSDWRLSPQNVVFAKHIGESDPLSIVRYGLRYFKQEKDFDKLFIIVDRDRHPTYQDAVNIINSLSEKLNSKIFLITSFPSFEIWLLLHFAYSTAPLQHPGINGSDASIAIARLKAGHLPNYEKNCRGVYALIKDRLQTAIVNSRRLLQHHETCETDMNPSTKIHLVIEELRNIKSEKEN